MIEFARSQVEWMSDKIVRQFEETRTNPFHLRYVKLCHDLNELEKIRAPKVNFTVSNKTNLFFLYK